MTTIENVNSKNTMDADIVCISDDEEREVENRAVEAVTNKMKNVGFHFNVYENSYYVPESARQQLALLQKQPKPAPTHQQHLQHTKDTPKDVVVYVPDDSEEEVLLIGPIRKYARQILFGDKLSAPPAEFPYNTLLEIEKHLAKSLRNVSFTTETNVWNCTLEQLSCIKIAYAGLIDVSNLLLLFIFFVIIFYLKKYGKMVFQLMVNLVIFSNLNFVCLC